jgi:hypothetical protein
MHIEILKHPIKGFQVRVVDADENPPNVHVSDD